MIKAEVLLREAQREVSSNEVLEESMTSNAFYLSLLMKDKEDLMKQLHELNLQIRKLEESLRGMP